MTTNQSQHKNKLRIRTYNYACLLILGTQGFAHVLQMSPLILILAVDFNLLLPLCVSVFARSTS